MTDESAMYEKETSRNSMAHFVATISFASGLSCRTLAMVRRQVTGILTVDASRQLNLGLPRCARCIHVLANMMSD